MSRGYGWRGGCPAADVPDVGAGSVEWFGRCLHELASKCFVPGIFNCSLKFAVSLDRLSNIILDLLLKLSGRG